MSNLPDEQKAALAAKAQAQCLSAEQYVRLLVERDLVPEWLQKSWETSRQAGLDHPRKSSCCGGGAIQLCISGKIYAEYEEVLSRPRFQRPEEVVAGALRAIRDKSLWVRPAYAIHLHARAHTWRQLGLFGSASSMSTGPFPKIANTAGPPASFFTPS